MLGAGMMGAGIAYVCARGGIEVVLKDVTLEARREGQGLLGQAVRQGRVAAARSTQEKADEILARITPTDNGRGPARAPTW